MRRRTPRTGATRMWVVLCLAAAVGCRSSKTPVAPSKGTVTGVVTERTTQGDRPFQGATLDALVEVEQASRTVVTDAQGRYELSDLPSGSRVWFTMTAHALVSGCAMVVTAVAGNVTFNALVTHDGPFSPPAADAPGFRSVSGVVYEVPASGRKPLPGAEVLFGISYGSGTRYVLNSAADSEGRFRLCGLPEAAAGVVVATDWDARRGQTGVPAGSNTNIEIEVR